jgi:hypothetical protein
MLELAETTMRLRGTVVEFVKKAVPADDPQWRSPDISKATRMLGFEPGISLERGMTESARRARIAGLAAGADVNRRSRRSASPSKRRPSVTVDRRAPAFG